MTREEAVRRIERVAEEKLIELDLSGLNLEELPPEIGKCTQLETLLLGKWEEEKEEWVGNKLTEFPDAVLQLTNLKRLTLCDNQITAIPEDLGQLSNLTHLTLFGTQITSIPEDLGQLSNLRWLYRAWKSDYLHLRRDRATVQSEMALPSVKIRLPPSQTRSGNCPI